MTRYVIPDSRLTFEKAVALLPRLDWAGEAEQHALIKGHWAELAAFCWKMTEGILDAVEGLAKRTWTSARARTLKGLTYVQSTLAKAQRACSKAGVHVQAAAYELVILWRWIKQLKVRRNWATFVRQLFGRRDHDQRPPPPGKDSTRPGDPSTREAFRLLLAAFNEAFPPVSPWMLL